MEVYKTKGVIIKYPLAAFFAMLIILLSGYCCAASVIVKSNTTFRCDGRLDECLLEDDLELEFLMNPYVSRVLAGGGSDGDPNNKDLPVFKACGGPKEPKNRVPYQPCVAEFIENHNGCNIVNIYAGKGCGQ